MQGFLKHKDRNIECFFRCEVLRPSLTFKFANHQSFWKAHNAAVNNFQSVHTIEIMISGFCVFDFVFHPLRKINQKITITAMGTFRSVFYNEGNNPGGTSCNTDTLTKQRVSM